VVRRILLVSLIVWAGTAGQVAAEPAQEASAASPKAKSPPQTTEPAATQHREKQKPSDDGDDDLIKNMDLIENLDLLNALEVIGAASASDTPEEEF